MEAAEKAEQWAKAIEVARQLVSLRTARQGADHWEVFSAQQQLRDLQATAARPAGERAALAKAIQLTRLVARDTAAGGNNSALEPAAEALAIRERLLPPGHPMIVQSLNYLAGMQMRRGRYAQAEPLLLRAQRLCQEHLPAGHPLTVFTINNLAALYQDQQQPAKAEPYLVRARQLSEANLPLGHPAIAASLNNLAMLYQDQGKYAQAEPLLLRAQQLCEEHLPAGHPNIVNSLENLAAFYREQGQIARAEPYLVRAVELREQHLPAGHPNIAFSLLALANLYQDEGYYSKAEVLALRALALFERSLPGGHPAIGGVLNDLGFLYCAQGRYAKAELFYRRSLELSERNAPEGNAHVATVLNNLGSLYREQAQYTKAAPLFQRTLQLRERWLPAGSPLIADSLNNLATIDEAQGRYAEVEAALLRAQRLYEQGLPAGHPKIALNLNNLAALYRDQGQYAKAEPLYWRALRLFEQRLPPGHPNVAIARNNLALLYAAQGQYAKAEPLLRQAVTTLELGRRQLSHYGRERAAVTSRFDAPVWLALVEAQLHRPAEAFADAERALARGLLDDLGAAQATMLTAAEHRLESNLQDQLTRLESTMAALADHHETTTDHPLEDLRRQHAAAESEWAVFRLALEAKYGAKQGKPYPLARIQEQLPTDTALVAWIDRTAEHWAFVLRHQGEPACVNLAAGQPWSKEEAALPATFAAACAARGTIGRLAAALYQQRLAPLEPALRAGAGAPAVRHLIVLNSPALAGVPLAPLLERHRPNCSVSYAPSGTIFAWLREGRAAFQRVQQNRRPCLLALGAPVFADDSKPPGPPPQGVTLAAAVRGGEEYWKPLPATRQEVAAIAQTIHTVGGTAKTLLGLDAAEPAVAALVEKDTLKDYRYLHFATHGSMNTATPYASALVLSQVGLPDAYEQFRKKLPIWDGKLSAAEMLGWHLDADLVVLSACSTAHGQDLGVEGTMSFAPALLLAGARSVIVGLWEVDDAATALLMQRLYENLLLRKQSKAEALRNAQAWLRMLSRAERDAALATLPEGARGPSRIRKRVSDESAGEKAVEHPYSHPYYWAAFVLVGDPE